MDFFTYGRNCCQKLICPYDRALLGISSGPEVRQIFNIQTVLKPDFFLPGRQTFNRRIMVEKEHKKFQKFQKKNFKFFFKIFFFIYFWHQIQWPYLMRIDNPYLVGKMFKNISPDSVRSGRTCPVNLGVPSCPVRKLICPVRLSPSTTALMP